MCQQMRVLEKVRQAGEINGFGVELAEAQAQDFMSLNRQVNSLVKKNTAMEKRQIEQGKALDEQAKTLAYITGKVEFLVKQATSPLDEERIQGAYWRALATVMKSKTMWLVLVIIIFLIAMTGSEIKHLLGWLPTTVGA